MCVSCNAIHRLSMGGCECKCSSGVCAHEEHAWTDEHIGYIGFVVVVKNQLHRPCLPFQNIDPKTLVWSSSWRVPSLHGGTPPSPHKHCPTHAPNSHTNPLSASNHQSICKKTTPIQCGGVDPSSWAIRNRLLPNTCVGAVEDLAFVTETDLELLGSVAFSASQHLARVVSLALLTIWTCRTISHPTIPYCMPSSRSLSSKLSPSSHLSSTRCFANMGVR